MQTTQTASTLPVLISALKVISHGPSGRRCHQEPDAALHPSRPTNLAEPIALFTPERLTALVLGLSVTTPRNQAPSLITSFAPASMALSRTDRVRRRLFARIRVCVGLSRRWWLCVLGRLDTVHGLSSSLFSCCALGAVSVDFPLRKVVGAAAGDYQDAPAVAVEVGLVTGGQGIATKVVGDVPD